MANCVILRMASATPTLPKSPDSPNKKPIYALRTPVKIRVQKSSFQILRVFFMDGSSCDGRHQDFGDYCELWERYTDYMVTCNYFQHTVRDKGDGTEYLYFEPKTQSVYTTSIGIEALRQNSSNHIPRRTDVVSRFVRSKEIADADIGTDEVLANMVDEVQILENTPLAGENNRRPLAPPPIARSHYRPPFAPITTDRPMAVKAGSVHFAKAPTSVPARNPPKIERYTREELLERYIQDDREINVQSLGMQCKLCQYTVTGITEGYCCLGCQQAGARNLHFDEEHGARCKRVHFRTGKVCFINPEREGTKSHGKRGKQIWFTAWFRDNPFPPQLQNQKLDEKVETKTEPSRVRHFLPRSRSPVQRKTHKKEESLDSSVPHDVDDQPRVSLQAASSSSQHLGRPRLIPNKASATILPRSVVLRPKPTLRRRDAVNS